MICQNWKDIFKTLYFGSNEINARGIKCYEIEDFCFYIDQPFANFPSRKLSLPYIAKEFNWYLSGDRNNTYIEETSSFWATIKNKKKPYYNSNYGYYFFTENQFQYIVDKLIEDKDSRQATIVLNRPEVMMSESSDKICTNAISFRIRDNKLNMSVSMRSNDLIYGTCIDVPQFFFIREMVLIMLKQFYPKLEVGTYFHKADSLHFYERHLKMVTSIVENNEEVHPINLPKIHSSYEVKDLIDFKLNDLPRSESYEFTQKMQHLVSQ